MMNSLNLYMGLLILGFVQGSAISKGIRKWKSPQDPQKRHISINGFNSNNYYVSAASTNWISALSACKNFMGDSASLLAVDTIEEWSFIALMLELYETGDTYWTDGVYNPVATPYPYSWRDDESLGPWAPWGPNQPPSQGFPFQRVAILHTSRFSTDWRIMADSQPSRFICEYPNWPNSSVPEFPESPSCDGYPKEGVLTYNVAAFNHEANFSLIVNLIVLITMHLFMF